MSFKHRIPIPEIKKEFPIGVVVDCFFTHRPDGLLVDDGKGSYAWPEMSELGDVINFLDNRLKSLGGARSLSVLSGLYGQPLARWQAELKRLAALLAQNAPPIPPTIEPKRETRPAIECPGEDVIRGYYGPIDLQDQRVKEALRLVENAGFDLDSQIRRLLRMDFMGAIVETRFPPKLFTPLAGIATEAADVCSFCYEDLPEVWSDNGAYLATSVREDDYSPQRGEFSGVYCQECVKKTFPVWVKANDQVLEYLARCWRDHTNS